MKTKTVSVITRLKRASALTAIILSVIVISSCEKKDETPASYYEIDGVRYDISSSALSFNGNGFDPVNISYRYTLYLTSGDASITSWAGNDAVISGTGRIMILNLNTTDGIMPAAGTYPEWTQGATGNYLGGAGYYDVTMGTNGEGTELDEGSAELSYEGDTMTVTYEGKDEYGRDVTIVFTGKPSFYDASDNS